MKRYKEMNEHEKIAYRNIKGIFDWEVGGWYNCYLDDEVECIPELDEAKEIIYNGAISDKAEPGFYQVGRAPQEMRFAGKEFIKEVIDWLFEHDDDVKDLRTMGYLK